MALETVACEVCGKQFQAQACYKRRFCSHSCSSSFNRRKAAAAGKILGRKKTGQVCACQQCGKEFYRKQWQEKQGTGLFCSRDCQTAWQRRNSITRPCEWCDKSMTMSPFRSEIQRFCSWECQTEGRSRTALERWHNGRRVRKNADGYILIYEPDNPHAYKDGWMPEHRYVVEQILGRFLDTEEIVHHVNAQRDDNRPENLQILSSREHQAITNAVMTAKRRAETDELEEYRRRFGPLNE